jgi:hypothetical protein
LEKKPSIPRNVPNPKQKSGQNFPTSRETFRNSKKFSGRRPAAAGTAGLEDNAQTHEADSSHLETLSKQKDGRAKPVRSEPFLVWSDL